ncbi:hypothetical protein [Scytonema sp. PCC 10023]|uniref:hypothetical protein n=1 Tax=Scytonema sp. PCC 10023 TaxID=1680591 RepID=UPI0039C5F575
MHTTEKYTERVQKLRAEYWTTIGSVNLKDLVFIDVVMQQQLYIEEFPGKLQAR